MSVRNDALRRAARNSLQGKRRKARPVKVHAGMTVEKLHTIARARGVKFTTKTRKADLLAALTG